MQNAMIVSHRTLVVVAAVIWYGGGVSLVIKGGTLIREAYDVDAGLTGAPLAVFAGIAAGWLKARFIFTRSCRRNLGRIAKLETPRLWQCFRPGFLLFLAIIIPAGAVMSRLAEGHYRALCLVGALDLSIATALLVSSLVFWRQLAFSTAWRS